MKLISRLPDETALSLTDEQLSHLKIAIGSGGYSKHKLDVRGTLPIPFYPSRFYFVFLMGRNVRSITRNEETITMMAILFLTFIFLLLSVVLGLFALYILKSVLGINFFEDFSLGLLAALLC
jgi:hypothetical protein